MDSGRLAGLIAELKGQLQLLNRVADRLQQRVAAGLDCHECFEGFSAFCEPWLWRRN